MRHGVLRQKRRLEPDFRSDPFPFAMWRVGRMIATSAAAELWAEVGALDLIELLNLLPGRIAHSSGNIDFKVQDAQGSLSGKTDEN